MRNLRYFLGEALPFSADKVELVAPCGAVKDLESLASLDDHFAGLVKEALAQGKVLHFTGSLTAAGAFVISLKDFPQSHSFARLRSSEKLLTFKTKGSASVQSLKESALPLSSLPKVVSATARQLIKVITSDHPSISLN